MHHPPAARGKPLRRGGVVARRLVDRQGIDVDAQADGRARPARIIQRDASGIALAGDRIVAHPPAFDRAQKGGARDHLISRALQPLDDPRGRAHLLPAQFGIGVEGAPLGNKLRLLLGCGARQQFTGAAREGGKWASLSHGVDAMTRAAPRQAPVSRVDAR
jgi:hypothetical protein